MKPLYLKFTDDEIIYSDNKDLSNQKSYKFNSKQELKENFQNFAKILSTPVDVLVLTNARESLLNKNLITYNNQTISCRNDLENIFHVPVVDMEDIRKDGLALATHNAISYSGWHLDYNHLDHDKRQYGQESMQTIGNGFLGLRGTYLEAKASDDNYPATYVAGVFNQLSTPINDRDVINEDLVNLPNSQYISFKVDEGDYLRIKDDLVQESVRSLDMKHGILTISTMYKVG